MNKSIVDNIDALTIKKAESATPITGANLKYITDNIKCVDKSKITYLANNVNRLETIGKFTSTLKNIDAGIKIEAGIFEFTLVYSLIKNFTNSILPAIYNDKVFDILKNLDMNNSIANNTLFEKINKGEIDAQTIAFLKPQDLYPDRWDDLIKKSKLREEKRKNIATTDAYTCYKCKGKRCSLIELQLRSADEPMTKIITCLDCYNVMRK